MKNAECGGVAHESHESHERKEECGGVAHESHESHERKGELQSIDLPDTSYPTPADSLRTTTSLCSTLQGGDAGADFTAVELQQMLEDKLAVLEVEQRELKRLLAADLEMDGKKRGVIDV